MKILVVDDNAGLRTALSRWLVGRGHEVRGADTAERGIEIMRAERIDLALVDVMLPVMAGDELAEAKLRDPDLARIPVVLMTGMSREEQVERWGDRVVLVGATTLMTKPFSLEDLAAEIERAARAGE